MTIPETDRDVLNLRDLCQSLQRSILRLRQEAESFHDRLSQEETDAISGPTPALNKLEGLIRDCQKVEKFLAERNALTLAETTELDLDAAKHEIRDRLARLRAARDAGKVSE
ncbi:hypothetical protein RSK20926_20635 [Roseobacter sp. SK209-2-6]|uniref:hypothetical protein n=1 Tax=Roseobacter sp. SK209-2-6 TaxID=388739 RepID=UPI0000F3E732|nr:hypothetical protein [Roseobacter sp. SK209-2-6]EBA16171.1 hypothetical protein RSK20926_20635 [Roseobacter sp. SK209-2-6]